MATLECELNYRAWMEEWGVVKMRFETGEYDHGWQFTLDEERWGVSGVEGPIRVLVDKERAGYREAMVRVQDSLEHWDDVIRSVWTGVTL